MKRRFFNFAAILSLLLCLACLALLVRSGLVEDYVSKVDVARAMRFYSSGGVVGFCHEAEPRLQRKARPWRWTHERNLKPVWWWLPGYQTWIGSGVAGWEAWLPYWLLCLGSALLPGLWGWKRRRQKRRRGRRGFPVEARA